MPSKSNHVCIPCKKEMRPVRVGVNVEEHREDGSAHKIWSADVLECPGCGYRILAGFSDRPLARHHDSHYEEELKKVEFHIR